MKLEMFSVYDEKAIAFLRPFCMPNINMAVRGIKDSACEPDHAFTRNPGDYALYQIGTFDEDTSELIGYKPPILILSITQCMEGYSVENPDEEGLKRA